MRRSPAPGETHESCREKRYPASLWEVFVSAVAQFCERAAVRDPQVGVDQEIARCRATRTADPQDMPAFLDGPLCSGLLTVTTGNLLEIKGGQLTAGKEIGITR